METVEKRIHALTNICRAKEGELAYFVHETFVCWGIDLSENEVENIFTDAYWEAATILHDLPEQAEIELSGWFRRILFLNCLNCLENMTDDPEMLDAIRYSNIYNDLLEMLMTFDSMSEENALLVSNLLKSLTNLEQKILYLGSEGFMNDEILSFIEADDKVSVSEMRINALGKLQSNFDT